MLPESVAVSEADSNSTGRTRTKVESDVSVTESSGDEDEDMTAVSSLNQTDFKSDVITVIIEYLLCHSAYKYTNNGDEVLWDLLFSYWCRK